MNTWIDHNALALLAAWYVFSAIVSGMPAPTGRSGTAYCWAYHSLHVLAGDLARFWFRSSQPGNGATHGVDIQH